MFSEEHLKILSSMGNHSVPGDVKISKLNGKRLIFVGHSANRRHSGLCCSNSYYLQIRAWQNIFFAKKCGCVERFFYSNLALKKVICKFTICVESQEQNKILFRNKKRYISGFDLFRSFTIANECLLSSEWLLLKIIYSKNIKYAWPNAALFQKCLFITEIMNCFRIYTHKINSQPLASINTSSSVN